jgi:hypothetical protein
MGTNEDEDLVPYHPNLLHDFVTNSSLSWSNRLSSFFYSYIYWLIIAYLYIVATYHQSLFYLLILLACFFLLWHGQTFLQRSFNHQKSFWRLLILSFFSLFLAHLLMQPLSCIFIHYASIQYHCILIHLFNVPCSIKLFRKIYAKDCPENHFWTQIRGIIKNFLTRERPQMSRAVLNGSHAILCSSWCESFVPIRELRVHVFLDPDPTKSKFLDPDPNLDLTKNKTLDPGPDLDPTEKRKLDPDPDPDPTEKRKLNPDPDPVGPGSGRTRSSLVPIPCC